MVVTSDVFFGREETSQHVKRVKACKCFVAEVTHEELGKDGFEKKLRRAAESSEATSFLSKEKKLNAPLKQLPPAASGYFFYTRKSFNWNGALYFSTVQQDDKTNSV